MPPTRTFAERPATPVALPPDRMHDLLTQKLKPNEMLTALFGTVRPVSATPELEPAGAGRTIEVAAAR